MGLRYVSEESIQDADSGYYRVQEDFPPTSRLHRKEPHLHPDRTRVCFIGQSFPRVLLTLERPSNRLLTSGAWAWSRKPVGVCFMFVWCALLTAFE